MTRSNPNRKTLPASDGTPERITDSEGWIYTRKKPPGNVTPFWNREAEPAKKGWQMIPPSANETRQPSPQGRRAAGSQFGSTAISGLQSFAPRPGPPAAVKALAKLGNRLRRKFGAVWLGVAVFGFAGCQTLAPSQQHQLQAAEEMHANLNSELAEAAEVVGTLLYYVLQCFPGYH